GLAKVSRRRRSDERRRGRGAVGARKEEGVFEGTAGDDASAGDQAAREPGARLDRGPREDDAPVEPRARAVESAAEDARPGLEAVWRLDREDAGRLVEGAGAPRKGPTALERFERRAEEIARAAEVGEGARVPDETDLEAVLEHRLP